MSKILYVPLKPHSHDVHEFRGKPIEYGTTAICDGCGKVVVYDVSWWEPSPSSACWELEGWFHRWRRVWRERKKSNAWRKEQIDKVDRTLF